MSSNLKNTRAVRIDLGGKFKWFEFHLVLISGSGYRDRMLDIQRDRRVD